MTGWHVAFALGLAVLAYTFAGYPLLLAMWARVRPRPVRKGPFEPPVAIVIPVHDGEALIEAKIASCLAQDYPAERLRILVASDGSRDRTNERVRGMGEARVTLLAFPERRGKAACVNDAIAACTEEVLVMTDVRQTLHPRAVRRLLENLADPEVGAVSGKLLHAREGMSELGEGLDAYWRYEQLLRKLESRVHSMVGVLGAFYAVRRAYFRPMPADTILDDMMVPMRVALLGRRVVFEEEALVFDKALSDPARERSRKVRTLAGNFQLLARCPVLVLPWRNPLALQFLSHKVMRLLGPLALATALVANVALAPTQPFFAATLAAQVLAYAAAVLGLAWPRAAHLRVVKLAAAFLSLNAFVVLGFVEYAFHRDIHLWQNPRTRTSSRE